MHAYIGALVTQYEDHGEESYAVLQLQPSDPMSSDKPPPLYEPVLIRFAPIAFRVRGFERIGKGDNAFTVVQEWHVEEA